MGQLLTPQQGPLPLDSHLPYNKKENNFEAIPALGDTQAIGSLLYGTGADSGMGLVEGGAPGSPVAERGWLEAPLPATRGHCGPCACIPGPFQLPLPPGSSQPVSSAQGRDTHLLLSITGPALSPGPGGADTGLPVGHLPATPCHPPALQRGDGLQAGRGPHTAFPCPIPRQVRRTAPPPLQEHVLLTKVSLPAPL